MVELVQADDARMVEPRGRARLALGPRDAGAAVLARDHLHGHVALEPLVVRQPDDAESARAKHPLEAVAVEHEPGVGRLRQRVRAQPVRPLGLEQLLGRHRSFHRRFEVRRPSAGLPAQDVRQSARSGILAACVSFLDDRDDPTAPAQAAAPPAAERAVDRPADAARPPGDRGRRRAARRCCCSSSGSAAARRRRRSRASRTTSSDAEELVAESEQQSMALFELLDDPGNSEVDFTSNVNGSRCRRSSSSTARTASTSRAS